MPELPEVETARRTLESFSVGNRIVRAKAEASRLLRELSPAAFARGLEGRKVLGALRRGKQLLLILEEDQALGVHLGMTGKILGRPRGASAPPYSRAFLELEGGSRLHFISRRLFGQLLLGSPREVQARTGWHDLGPDPLSDGLSAATLREALGESRQPVKVRLMDQRVIAGLGNIQAGEALFRSRIDPRKPAGALDRGEHARLVRAIHRSLTHTLEHLDPTEARYLADAGETENPFLVYGREGEPCPRCKTTLVRFMLGGRVTFACPGCQSSPGNA
ncbi:MAG: bifunctional DNA-formamidopyrimidine glycosylase/DNA-(apurinic or apyrimidinic site) lyase [Deltaproteobacteria bacterium]|nr:bifunctional DNA-formamidopyrimidine glycosylase/DNA-(apurinic or apyrimidinic site) lyase [Deltaproteobacteria bacterium]